MARYRRRRRTRNRTGLSRHILYGILLLLFVSALGYAAWYLTRLPAVTIEMIDVSGTKTVSEEAVRTKAEEVLQKSYLLLIPKRFSYLYPRKAIEESVSSILRVRKASAERIDRNTIRIAIEEYTPSFLWCASECVYVSKEGYAYDDAPPLSGGAYVRYETEERMPEAGTQLADAVLLQDTRALAAAMERTFAFRVRHITITTHDDLVLRLAGGGEILTAPDVGAQNTFDNLRSILESEEYQHLAPGNFEYIDLRFGNRVFVAEEPLEEAAATSTEPLPEEE